MSKELQISIHFIELILSNGGEPTVDGIKDLFEIKADNKGLLLEHLKAINSIFNTAIEELQRENGK